MKTGIVNFIQQFKQRSGEHEQVLFRVVFVSAILAYLVIQFRLHGSDAISPSAILVTLATLTFSLLLVIAIVISGQASRARQWLAMFVDIAACSYVMVTTHEYGVVLFGGYMWVITGNCLRYGNRAMVAAYVASLVGFGCVMRYNEYWIEHSMTATGFMIALALVPMYVLKLRNQLNAALEDAKEANKAKSQFLAHMSHEMRTPLNGLVGVGDLLTTTPLNDEQADLVRTLQNSSKILRLMVDNVLDLAKIESGKMLSEKVDFDLHDLINNAIEIFTPQAAKKALALNVRFTSDTTFALRGDAMHLLQVIINLLGNAIKFTEKGSIELRISTIKEDAEITKIRFEVIDTGIGIAPQFQRTIFEGFTQADSSIARRYGGSGLGTTISRDLVNLMGGHIGVESELGVGSTFWFALPFEKQKVNFDNATSIEQLFVISVGLSANEKLALAGHLNGWDVRFEHADSAQQFFPRLSQLQASLKGAVVVLCSPHNIGMDAHDFAKKTLNINPHAKTSLILLSPVVQNSNDASYLEIGYAATMRTLQDKPALFNALHTVITPRQGAGVISLTERYARTVEKRHGVRILVADDNGTNRKIIARLLEFAGHQVELVEDGDAALDKLEFEHFDLMILDMNMPNVGGLEVVKIHRALPGSGNHIPTIILTANATNEARIECSNVGVEAYLTKPVDTILLLNTIANLTASDSPIDDTERANVWNQEEDTLDELINVKTLNQLELLGHGRENFMSVLIQGYLSETESLFNKMRVELAANNFASLKELAHFLKGSAGNMGAEALQLIFDEMMNSSEDELKQNGRALFKHAHTCFNSTKILLVQFLAKSARFPIHTHDSKAS